MNFIPLQKKRKYNNFDSVPSSQKRRRVRPISYGGDHLLFPRIKELMDVSKNSSFIDEDQLLADLQSNYPEYRRKKKNVLKAAISNVISMYGGERNSSNEEGSIQSFVNDAEFSPDERHVAYEGSKFPKKTKLKKNKEYLLEKETVNIPQINPLDKKAKVLKYSTQESKIKDTDVKKYEKIPRSLKKQQNEDTIPQYPTVTFSDIGGQDATLFKLCSLLKPLNFPKVSSLVRPKRPPHGILLHGPPGCGKTFLASAIAGEMKFPLLQVAATDLITGISGESEEKIRNLFDQAVSCSPCVLFIDEIDAIASKRELTSRGMEKRVVSQLLTCMNDIRTKHIDSQVLVIGATNTPDVLDPALRRGGRFGREIGIGIPDEAARISILQVVCKGFRLARDFDFQWLASRTPGYVGGDLADLVEVAADVAIDRILDKLCPMFESDSEMQAKLLQLLKEAGFPVTSIREVPRVFLSTEKAAIIRTRAMFSVSENEVLPIIEKFMEDCFIGVEDFQACLETYVPCSKREGFATVSSVPWSRIGGLKKVQKELQKAVLWPLKYKEACAMFKYTPPSGMLLWGPKGCGKTLLAKAVASECGINFIPVKGPELLSMYVGESERAVRQVFQRARNSAPCVVLFDELDSLCPPRSNSFGDNSTARVVNQLLAEIDGMGPKAHIFIIGTTNRLENIDSAMLRPGRLETSLYIGLPTPEERVEILKALTKNGTDPQLADEVDLEALGLSSRCNGFSGADLESLLRIASSKALEDRISGNVDVNLSKGAISMSHFDLASNEIYPSVSEEERNYFEKLKVSREKKGE